ncbi:MAG: bifunctional demethylmenaquinone methyltransferase/2-methoxy-6-polyprenyl-1,4-benzoquinol methylase UbiE [Ignavibacteria bacterium]|nr:bifunctional demethylmenaquinone methyltransferase/2-methoxy-6-polyprenyl-1,4-benzoquinol methylase UbiE [Bacteroidota bacterium]MSQ46423.1 bifunctional demethylmenaquinone methyltransferase/2-methoxy-6-polyprenyl-1,4-benzoquinol methylase UbiE [Ignavibacteria bacterium]
MQELKHDKVVPFENSALSKKDQVANMFNRIANRYDLLNHLLSANIDKLWRRKAILKLSNDNPKIILDVATGTGDMAIMILKYLHPEKIVGVDISTNMLEFGKKKIETLKLQNIIQLEEGDCESLKYSSNSFDAVTVAFGVRNFENLIKGLQEINRVLKVGGKVIILEFSKPKNIFIKQFYNFYLSVIIPSVGKILSKSNEAYKYLGESVLAFPEGDSFLKVLSEAGFSDVKLQTLSFGISTIYIAKK